MFFCRKYSIYQAPVDDWAAILTLAHKWGFPEVKALCVRELEQLYMTDIDRVVLYHEQDVDRSLLLPQYAALCQREEPISLQEGLRLGLETSLVLAHYREPTVSLMVGRWLAMANLGWR